MGVDMSGEKEWETTTITLLIAHDLWGVGRETKTIRT
jgi:hypothetical protein